MARHSSKRPLWLGALPLLATCLVFAGCGDDDSEAGSTSTTSSGGSGGLTVTVEPAQAAPGDTVKASVVNDTGKDFTYGAAYELELKADDSWGKVKLPVRPVPEIGYVAASGEPGPPVDVELPKDLATGTYRVVIQRDVPGVGDLSGEFDVTGES